MRKVVRKVIATALMVASMSALSINSMASNVEYGFHLGNTGVDYKVFDAVSNTKAYASDSATVKANPHNAPGYGFAFCMKHKLTSGYEIDTVTSPGQWIGSAGGTIHPAYLANHNIINRAYYVAARIDNDYNGPYYVKGLFNSDYTNP